MTSPLQFQFNDLSLIPAPDIVEKLNYEQLWQQKKNEFNALQPRLLDENQQPVILAAELIKTDNETYWKVPVNDDAGLYYLDLESDPVTRILEDDTYRELLIRNRVNHAALQTMSAYATGTNLDHKAAGYGVYRLTITAENTSTTPPIPAVLESDNALRRRMLLAMEGLARGGSEGWYLFNTLTASGDIKDAHIATPEPCEIVITVLSHNGNGTADQALLDTVTEYIQGKYRRVLGDKITVQSADVIEYELNASITYYPGPSHKPTDDAITAAWAEYRKESERIGHYITDSGVKSALHQHGVYRAIVSSPQLPIAIQTHQAPYCTGLNLSDGGDYV